MNVYLTEIIIYAYKNVNIYLLIYMLLAAKIAI